MLLTPYYERAGVTIYHGDSLEIMGDLGPRSVDWVLTDPPFYLPATYYSSRQSWPKSLGDMAIMHGYFRQAFLLALDCVKPTGGLYCFCDTIAHAVFVSVLYPLVDGLQTIVWDKQDGGMGRGWRHSHEFILHGRHKATQYGDGFRRDVLSCQTVPSPDRMHPAEKPLGLLISLLNSMPPNVIVLDPFGGGGTLGLAAMATGRRAILIEIEEKYCEIAATRLSQNVMFPAPALATIPTSSDLFADLEVPA